MSPPPALAPPAFDLQEANSRLRFWLDHLTCDRPNTAPVTPEQMAALLSELMQAGLWLRSRQPQVKDRVREQEDNAQVDEYRRNLEKMRDLLPTIHQQLLAERARLESERVRVQSTAAWARRARQTL